MRVGVGRWSRVLPGGTGGGCGSTALASPGSTIRRNRVTAARRGWGFWGGDNPGYALHSYMLTLKARQIDCLPE